MNETRKAPGGWGIIDGPLSRQEGRNVWIACQYFATERDAESYRKKHCPVDGKVVFDPEYRAEETQSKPTKKLWWKLVPISEEEKDRMLLSEGDSYEIVGFCGYSSDLKRAVNAYDALMEFAKAHHETCEYCEGTGKIYNNADPTSGQWVACPIAELIEAVRS